MMLILAVIIYSLASVAVLVAGEFAGERVEAIWEICPESPEYLHLFPNKVMKKCFLARFNAKSCPCL